MAWSIVGVSTVVEVTATTHTLTEPAGVAQGDLLIAVIVSRIASTTSITLPTGGAWTLVNEQKANNTLTTSSALPSAMMAYAVRGASAPNYIFTHPTAPSVAIGCVIAYRGGATTTPLDVQTAATTATGVTAVSVTGLTTTVANDLIVALAAGGQEANWSSFNATTPAGASGATDTTTAPSATWRERADSITTTGADTSLGVFDALKTAAGATGNLTVTASVAAGHSIVAGAFKILPTLVPVAGLSAITSLGPAPQQISFAIGGPLGVSFGSGTATRQYMESAGYIAETILTIPPVSVVIAAGGSASVAVSGLAATSSLGTATVSTATNVSIPVTGLGAVTSLGPPLQLRSFAAGGPLGAGFISETSIRQYMGTVGYVAEIAQPFPVFVVTTAGASVSVTGLSATVSLGAVSVSAGGSVSASVTGLLASGYVGAITVTAVGGTVGVWNGAAWVQKPVNVWTGAAWAQKPVKVWNGSAWV